MRIAVMALMLLSVSGLQGQLNQSSSAVHEYKDPPNAPVEVSIGIYIQGFLEINDKRMDYTLMMYYRESWKDSRTSVNKGPMIVHRSDTKKFWLPDIFIRNELSAATHNVMTENRLLKINSNGNMWHVRKITATMSCPMKFQRYPFDVQSCPIYFESFSYTMDVLFLGWLSIPVELGEDITCPGYTIFDKLLFDCSQNYTTGSYPCLETRFMLKRDVGFAFIEFFLPTIFLFAAAWMTFWTDLRSTTHRIVVSSVSLFLTCVLQRKMRNNLPAVNYFTAVEVWTAICFLHIFYTIVVHVAVSFMLNVTQKQSKVDTENEKLALEDETKSKSRTFFESLKDFALGDGLLNVRNAEKWKRRAELLNAISRLVLAVLFILVSVAYFVLYAR